MNDLFLALLLMAMSPLAGSRRQCSSRTRISAGCIVNTRRDLGLDGANVFGLFLGSFIITHEMPEGITLPELARDICVKTGRLKRSKMYLGPPLEMSLSRLMLPLFSTERRKKLYQKHYPLWGGVTNMNLNSLWPARDGEQAIDYLRAVSTGPVTPFVLSVTTVGDRINVGMSYRRTVFSVEDVQRVKAGLFEQLERWGRLA